MTKDFDPQQIRADFPIFKRKINGKRLAFLDSGASAQKPAAVIDAMAEFTRTSYSNVHRGIYTLSQESSDRYENTRTKVADFLKTASRQVIFVRGVTEAINLVAQCWGRKNLTSDDEILITMLEHHANIVPWQMLETEIGCKLKVANLNPDGSLDEVDFKAKLNAKTKLVAMTHMSNVIGTAPPVADLIQYIRQQPELQHTKILLDGAQAIVHGPVEPDKLDCDFYTFSAHKLYGPTGIGVLWGRYSVLESMPPYHGGGDMIEQVSFSGTTFQLPPMRFEAGTPNITATIGLSATLDYLADLDWDAVNRHEDDLINYAYTGLQANSKINLLPRPPGAGPVISFTHCDVHAHDLATILDTHGVCVRAGHHCAMPLIDHFGGDAVIRVSLGMYSIREDIDQLFQAIHAAEEIFA